LGKHQFSRPTEQLIMEQFSFSVLITIIAGVLVVSLSQPADNARYYRYQYRGDNRGPDILNVKTGN
jgi:hypothetical protein